MRDAIVKVRLTEEEKAALVRYSARTGTTVSKLIRDAASKVCSQRPIDQTARRDIAHLRRSLNAFLDVPTEMTIKEAKKAATRVLGGVSW
jgi:antitoxin component of RelBE/YafQ-DinJ toxin-antitoxin module